MSNSKVQNQEPKQTKDGMKKVYDSFSKHMTIIGGKIGNQRHMSSIRDGFATFMPLIIVGSLAVLFNNVFISNTSLLADWFGVSETENPEVFKQWGVVASYISPIFSGLWDATLGLFTVYLTFFIGYFLTGTYQDEYKIDKIFGGTISLAAWATLGPMWHGYLGITGMLTGIAFSLMVPTVYVRLACSKKLQITMPNGVPPAVAKSFSQLIPIILTMLIFGMIQPLWGAISRGAGFGLDVLPDGTTKTNDWYVFIKAVDKAVAAPLMELGNTPGAVFLISLLIGLFWFIGLHGTNVLAPILEPIWGGATISNAALYEKYGNAIYDKNFTDPITGNPLSLSLWTKGSFDTMVVIGGTGVTLAIVFAILLFSKSKSQRQIAKVSLAPGIFQINEPVMFGVPILLNITDFIRWLLVMPFLSLFTYAAHSTGFVKPVTVVIPWTTPPFIGAILATQDGWAFVMCAINFSIAFICYLPFVIIDSKKQIAQEIGSNKDEDIKNYINEEKEKSKKKRLALKNKIKHKFESLKRK